MQIGLKLVMTCSLSRPRLESSKTIQYLIDIVRKHKGKTIVPLNIHDLPIILTINLHFISVNSVSHMGC